MDSRSGSQDSRDLSRFGYAQELLREMGGFSNFALSFSIISILTGAVTLYGYGLEMGGPLEMTLGWPLATIFTLTVATSMAELCSAYPTSGAMYHWAADLGGPAWGWFVAWFNILGLVAALAGINYSCAQFILPFLDVPARNVNLLAMFAFILVTQGGLNHFGVKLVAILNDVSVAVHILGVAIVVAALFWFAPKQPASFLFQGMSSSGQAPYWWAFALGLLQAQWTYTGFDASAHMAEETQDPRRHAPWGIVLSVAVSGLAGYLLILALTLAISSVPEVLGARDADGSAVPAVIAILQSALGAKAGNVVSALASLAMWFCGLSVITSTSRTIYSLARDHGTPFASLLRRVNARHGTPGPAIWVTVATAFAAMLWSGAVPVVTSLSTVALYVAYGTPIALAFRARLRGTRWADDAPWSLGKAGGAVNAAAIVFSLFVCTILVMPPNELAGKTLGGLGLLLCALYWGVARHRYQGPDWARRETDLGQPAPQK